jgi:hypothetical protein
MNTAARNDRDRREEEKYVGAVSGTIGINTSFSSVLGY